MCQVPVRVRIRVAPLFDVDPLLFCLLAVQAVAEGAYTQVVVAMADARRRSPTSSDVAKGLFDAEKLGRSFVSLTSLCDAVGAFLNGDECSPCPSGATCPGAQLRPLNQLRGPLRLSQSVQPCGCAHTRKHSSGELPSGGRPCAV